ncbi:MAG TPA: Crp/Fnr family transcriptional regulator, partial [Mangrovimonas sp.]|nr:Crp/Fnr family transcriptional regulator [Mangrovimonas sp.]
MDSEAIYHSLNNISQITTEAWADFEPLLMPLALQRHDYLVQEGARVSDCFMLLEGIVRVFYNKDGNEYNKTFFVPGKFPTALTALISETPSALSFQALTPCELVQFSFLDFKGLFTKHRCWESLLLRVLETEWIKKERHDIRMVTNDALTNYLIFRKEFPDLENLIPQYHIASYLGITPIQLSRIRSQLVK